MKRSPLKRKTALKRSRKRRQMTPSAMVETIQNAMLRDGRCAYVESWAWMGQGADRWSVKIQCEGETQFHHRYEQSWLREDLSDPINGTDKAKLAAALKDIRLGATACYEHHKFLTSGQMDGRPEEYLPVAAARERDFYEALEEYGLVDKWENRQAKKVGNA